MGMVLFRNPILFGLVFCAALAVWAPGPVAAEDDDVAVADLVAAYGAAWASRDVERITALHTEDSEFVLYVDGAEPARGMAAVTAAFADILTANPDYASQARALFIGADFVVIEYDIVSPPLHEVRMGNVVFGKPASGTPFRLPAIDVITFEGSLVSSKRTYIDSELFRRQAGSVKVMQPDAEMTAQP